MGIADTDRTLPSNRMVFDVRRDMALYQRFRRNLEPAVALRCGMGGVVWDMN